MSSRPLLILIGALSAACTSNATEPSADSLVRVDVKATRNPARAGDIVELTVTAINQGKSTVSWTSGCGLDLSYEIRTADLEIPVEGPEFSSMCTEELRQLKLVPNETMQRVILWRIGSLPAPGRTTSPARYLVRGRLGVRDTTTRQGDQIKFAVVP